MSIFNKHNLPFILVISLIVWAWLSLFSVILGSVF